MPQLDGTSEYESVIRTYQDFSISFMEFDQSIRSPGKIMRYFVEKGVADICSDCIKKGYYICGLEKGFVEEVPVQTSIAVKQFRLTLGLYVRLLRTDGKLTNDELWYYTSRATERIISELNNPTMQSEGKLTVESLEKVKSLLDANLLSIPEAKSIIFDNPTPEEVALVKRVFTPAGKIIKQAPKQQYEIIKRPKSCYSNTTG